MSGPLIYLPLNIIKIIWLSKEQVVELNALHKQGLPIAKIARQFKITRPTVYSYLKNEK